MKTKYILFCLLAGIVFTSCKRDEESLFNESAAQRLSRAMATAEEYLTAAPNGWEVLYFPNTASAGHTILMKFDTNGRLTAATCNPITTNNFYQQDDKSTWAIKADYGPILSFDTFNEILHAWSDPQDDGDGYLGDYEFLILQAQSDYFRLKGKKHEAYILMHRLDAAMDWQDYFDQVYDERDLFATENDGMKMNITDGTTTLEYVYNYGILAIPDMPDSIFYPLIVRPGCIQLYDKGYNGACHFAFNEDRSALVCTDEGHTNVRIEPGYTISEYFAFRFNQKETRWAIADTDNSQDVANAIQALKKDATAKGAVITRLAFDGMRKTTGSAIQATLRVTYLVENTQQEGFINLTCSTENNVLTIQAGAADASIRPLLQRIAANEADAAKRFTDIVCGTYQMSSYSGSLLNMTQMSLTQGNKKIHIIADPYTI